MSSSAGATGDDRASAAELQELDELQRWMALSLRARRSLSNDPEAVALAEAHFTGNHRLKPVEQLEIYRQQFWLRHTSALLEDFPGLSGVLGQRTWEQLAEEYLIAYPPTSYTLRDLGARFAEHVERSTWLPQHDLCCDMARLEWAYVELFDSALLAPVSPEKIAAVTASGWQTAVLQLQPNLQFLSSRYPVAKLRLALKRAQLAAEQDQTIPDIDLPEPQLEQLVLYRRGDEMYREALTPAGFALLRKLHSGTPLVPACEAVASELPSAAASLEADLSGWFQRWASLGFFIDVVVA